MTILCFRVILYILIFLTGIGNKLLAQEKTDCEVCGNRVTYFINHKNGFVEPCNYLLSSV